jgi:uncharacterized membrane protein YoaK (UPF0700 family)
VYTLLRCHSTVRALRNSWAPITVPSPPRLAYILIALSALAMGLQMNAIRSLHVPGISTTAFSATFVDLASGLATWSLTAHSARRLTATMVSMAAGAFLGDWMLSHAHRMTERGQPQGIKGCWP